MKKLTSLAIPRLYCSMLPHWSNCTYLRMALALHRFTWTLGTCVPRKRRVPPHRSFLSVGKYLSYNASGDRHVAPAVSQIRAEYT